MFGWYHWGEVVCSFLKGNGGTVDLWVEGTGKRGERDKKLWSMCIVWEKNFFFKKNNLLQRLNKRMFFLGMVMPLLLKLNSFFILFSHLNRTSIKIKFSSYLSLHPQDSRVSLVILYPILLCFCINKVDSSCGKVFLIVKSRTLWG